MTRGRRTRPAFRPELVRLESRDTPTAVGALDPRFDTDGKLILNDSSIGFLDKVLVTPDGRTVVVGTTATTGGTPGDFLVERFLPDGTPDPTFGTNGKATVDFSGGSDDAFDAALLPDGSVVVVGSSSTSTDTDSAVALVSTTGTVLARTVRQVGGTGVFDEALHVAVNQSTKDIYVVGFSGSGEYIARFTSTLGPVGTTVTLPAAVGSVNGVAVAGDGRVYLGGTDFSGATPRPTAARLNADLSGLVTNSFTSGTASGIAVDPVTNRVYLAGATSGVSPSQALVVELNSDLGERNRTSIDLGNGSQANDVAVDSRGRVVVVGTNNTTTSTTTDVVVARLLPDTLALDETFNGTGKNVVNVTTADFARAVAIGPRDSITVLGSTEANPGSPGATFQPALVRLVGSVELPTALLSGGATNGTAELFTLPTPNDTRSNQAAYQATGASQNLTPGLDKNVRVAVGDVNGDGVDDYVAGSGPGATPRVRVIDGKTGGTIADFLAFEATFTGGVYVAAGDIDGDGKADVIVTPDQGGGPVVAVYSGAKLAAGQSGDAAQIVRYFGIDDPNFRGGARAALGDVNNDGVLDVVVSAGFLGGPRITVWDGKQLLAGNKIQMANFFAFEDTVRNGAFVAAGDVDGDGFADLIFGGGPTGGPRVRIASGKALTTGPGISSLDTATTPGLQLANFNVGDPSTRGGVRLATKDVDGDNLADVVAGSGDSLAANAVVIRGTSLKASGSNPNIDQTLTPFGGGVLTNGVFVG